MITLYGFGPAFGLPDPSAFVIKAALLLKLADLPYRLDTTGFRRAPKGKLPYIDDDGVVVPDSTFIRCHIERKYGIDFDAGLAADRRGALWAAEKMCEDQLYWAMVADRWLDDTNFANGPGQFFKRVPLPLRPFAVAFIRRGIRSDLKAHGFGRHTKAERGLLTQRAVDALAGILGDGPYLGGAAPCGADASVGAHVIAGLCSVFDADLRRQLAAHPNLVAYRDRLMATHFPETTGVA